MPNQRAATFFLLLAIGVLAASVPSAAPLAAREAGPKALEIRRLPPVRIWPGEAPAIPGWPGYEHGPVSEEMTPDGERVSNVADPAFEPFLPAPGKASGAGVIIAPGGGFRFLDIAWCRELGAWFADRGIAAFVLKYRTAPIVGDTKAMQARLWEMRRDVPGRAGVADGMAALRLIRADSARYGVRPGRMGVIGFSAGGHVAGMMALAADPALRPSFVGLIYGMPYEAELVALPAANEQPSLAHVMAPFTAPPPAPAADRLPPTFMAMAQDDRAAEVGFRRYYDRLFDAGYRPELHLYQKGGHGFSIRPAGTTADRFADEFVDWLDVEGFLAK